MSHACPRCVCTECNSCLCCQALGSVEPGFEGSHDLGTSWRRPCLKSPGFFVSIFDHDSTSLGAFCLLLAVEHACKLLDFGHRINILRPILLGLTMGLLRRAKFLNAWLVYLVFQIISRLLCIQQWRKIFGALPQSLCFQNGSVLV